MKKGWNEENRSMQRPSLYSPTMRTRGDEMNSQMHASRSIILGAMNLITKIRGQRVITGVIKDEAQNTTTQKVNGMVDVFFFSVFNKQ